MSDNQKITVLGAGRWGSLLAWLYHKYGRQVVLWNIKDQFLQEWLTTRRNKYLALSEEVEITGDLKKALAFSDIVFIVIKLQHLTDLCQKLKKQQLKGKLFILAMKGLELGTGRRPSEILKEELDSDIKIGFIGGPGHPQEMSQDIPTCMTVSSQDKDIIKRLVEICQTPLSKIYPNEDMVGVEVGAATKNVIGVAGGILDALNTPSLKSYLMARGPVEVGRLIEKMGGEFQTAYSLAHLGDYMATAFSYYSRSHEAGEMIVLEKKLHLEAEAVPTSKTVRMLMDRYNIDMPICLAVYKVLHEKEDPKSIIKILFDRSMEFE